MKNKKIIFNLTIDDLKELGIIRKRKRRQRKIKYINFDDLCLFVDSILFFFVFSSFLFIYLFIFT